MPTYNIYRSNQQNGVFTKVAEGIGEPPQTLNNQGAGIWYYRVSRVSDGGLESDLSAAVQQIVLAQPTGLNFTREMTRGVLKWNADGAAAKYIVYYKDGGVNTQLGETTTPELPVNFATLLKSTYDLYVKSLADKSESEYSAPLTVPRNIPPNLAMNWVQWGSMSRFSTNITASSYGYRFIIDGQEQVPDITGNEAYKIVSKTVAGETTGLVRTYDCGVITNGTLGRFTTVAPSISGALTVRQKGSSLPVTAELTWPGNVSNDGYLVYRVDETREVFLGRVIGGASGTRFEVSGIGAGTKIFRVYAAKWNPNNPGEYVWRSSNFLQTSFTPVTETVHFDGNVVCSKFLGNSVLLTTNLKYSVTPVNFTITASGPGISFNNYSQQEFIGVTVAIRYLLPSPSSAYGYIPITHAKNIFPREQVSICPSDVHTSFSVNNIMAREGVTSQLLCLINDNKDEISGDFSPIADQNTLHLKIVTG